MEHEPNDDVANANLITLGDTVKGQVDRAGDIDIFAVALEAGTEVDFKVIAMSIGSKLDSRLQLIAPDGKTVLETQDAEDIYLPDGTHDTRLRYRITTSGRYYLQLDPRGWPGGPTPGGPEYFYRLSFGRFVHPNAGPGDPTTIAVDGARQYLAYARKLLAGPDGDFYAVDLDLNVGSRVVHVSAGGAFKTVYGGTDADPMGGLALQASGNLLVSACERPNGVIWRITPSGARDRFYSGEFTAGPIVVGPDGDVWAWMGKNPGNETYQVWRFDANGNRKAVLPGVGELSFDAVDIAFSPAGDLYVASDNAIYKYVDGVPQRVAASGGRLAFDKDGYFYVAHGYQASRVSLLDPAARVVADTFALVGEHFLLENTFGIAFGRSSGSTTGRLFVTWTGEHGAVSGTIRQLNPRGIRAAGWPVGEQQSSSPMQVTGRALRAAVAGTSYADTLTATQAPGAVSWSVASGGLPNGITLLSSGVISGTTSDTGSFALDARATSGSASATGHFTLHVSGQQRVSVSVADIATALMGGASLTAEQVRYLDGLGNHNGILDVGDLRAYLRLQNQP